MIHIVRLLIAAAFIWGGIEQVLEDLYAAFSNESNSFRVSGVANIWASFCAPLFGFVLVIHVIMSVCKFGDPDRFFNRGALIMILIISPALTLVTKTKLITKIDSYVECQDLKRISRWNSYRLYAISADECQRLEDDKN